MKDLKADLVAEKIAKVESPRAFSKLLPIFRQASKEQIAQVLKDNDDVLWVVKIVYRAYKSIKKDRNSDKHSWAANHELYHKLFYSVYECISLWPVPEIFNNWSLQQLILSKIRPLCIDVVQLLKKTAPSSKWVPLLNQQYLMFYGFLTLGESQWFGQKRTTPNQVLIIWNGIYGIDLLKGCSLFRICKKHNHGGAFSINGSSVST